MKQYPLVGQVIYKYNNLFLVIGYYNLKIALYPLFLSSEYYQGSCDKEYYDKFIESCVNTVLNNTMRPEYLSFMDLVYSNNVGITYKLVKYNCISEKLYCTEDELRKWYNKSKLVHSKLGILEYDFEKILQRHKEKLSSVILEERNNLKLLGLYKLSEKTSYIYIGYHKVLDRELYIHIKTKWLGSNQVYKKGNLKAVTNFNTQMLNAEQIGTMLKTSELIDMLEETGLVYE